MLTTSNWTTFQSSYQTILTLSVSYYQTRVNTFSEFISNITGTLRELLANNTTHFSRHQAILTFSESYCQTILNTSPELTSSSTDIFRVTGQQYYTLFQRLHQAILTFSESYWQTILPSFPEFIPSNTDIIREFFPKQTIVKRLFRVHITQYWYIQRVTTNLYWLI